ncbi:MAG: polysaccharide pyruvyl transferase family protein [Lachnospiraceae bacterium]|nr:polysaccharide pyruvyl transferase family protein [Lachnospiraceae bacterium]
MAQNNVYNSTVEHNYCSGCGICINACDKKAISIDYNKTKQYVPIVNEEKCVNCGLCIQFCPNSIYTKNKCVNTLEKSIDRISVGIDNAVGFYRCKVRNNEDIIKSASGGFVSEFSKKLLSEGVIDCVVHAERVIAKTGEEHYRACISRTKEEIDSRRSSIYGAVCFNDVLETFRNKKDRILFVGVPCVIRGVTNLFNNNKSFSGNTIYSVALVCSHNVTGQFVDFFADYYGINRNTKYTANLRGKSLSMENRHDFTLNYYDEDGNCIISKDRSAFNIAWRNYYFAMPACNYCQDLWGWEADVSTKDCWEAEGNRDRYGSSLVIFRNEYLKKVFYNMHSFEITAISFERVRVSEYPSAIYKQEQIKDRIFESKGLFINNSESTIAEYEGGEYEIIKKRIDLLKDSKHKVKIDKDKFKSILKNALPTSLYPFIQWGKSVVKSVCLIIKPYQKKKYNKIIMLGGFDGSNAGDEAQIDSTIKIMMNRYPGYIIKVLSHVPYYTWMHHYGCVVGLNPRVAIWDMDENAYLYCSNLGNIINRIRFLIKGYWCCFNAHLIKHNLSPIFINSKKISLIEDIRTSDLLYISGGGTMTGDTLSRCWDNIFCMKIARVFKVPYALSGQNSGNWDSKFTARLVKNVYKDALVVTFRDVYAIDNVKKLGIEKDNVFTMFDDALFCDKEENVEKYLDLYDIHSKYLVLNIHYWGCENNETEQKMLLTKISKICDYVYEKAHLNILLLPMSDTDEKPIEDFLGFYDKEYVKVARFNEYDFKIIRGLIAKAQFCVTMKHHPIIFAIGESVPTISIAYKPYYTYKNSGALEIFGMGKYCINIEEEDYISLFKPLFDELYKNSEMIVEKIKGILPGIGSRREKFLKYIDLVLK